MMRLLDPRRHFRAARQMVGLWTRHRQLTLAMTRREISDRYAGQLAGTFWAIGHPLAQMAVYVFLFAAVFKARLGGTRDLPLDYVAYLLSGLLPWIAFQEVMSKSAVVVASNSNLVKQVVFPLEILPLKGVLAALVTQTITTTLLLLYILFSHGGLFWTHLLVPVLFFMEFLAMVGLAYLLSAIGVFLRDVKDLVQVASLLGMYLVPIAYVPDWVPSVLRPILYLNPFSYMVWCFQDAIYFGRFEHPYAWAAFGGGALLSSYLGFRVFSRLKVYFGNVL